MSDSTERWRKVARAAVEDAKKVADKHLPALRDSTRAVIDSELPKVKKEIPKAVEAVRQELPKVAEAIRREFRSRRRD
jgi:F0F1-type ATP synthase membrane subunit b/b'